MKRLTKKNGISYIPRHQYRDYNAVLNDIELKQAYSQAVDKLGQLEDIEDELGIELEIIFKALKQGYIWIKVYDDLSAKSFEKDIGTIIERKVLNITLFWIDTIDYESFSHKFNFLLKDYGKTWALTKEELL